MSIHREIHGNVDVVELPARLSMTDAGNVRENLRELIEQGRDHLVLDLAQISFMDSSGLSVLLSARKSVAQINGRVVLLNPSAEARLLIELTRLNEVFEIFIDKDAAIKYLS